MNNKAFISLCLLLATHSALQAEELPMYTENTASMTNTRLYVGASAGAARQGDGCNDPFFQGSCDDKDFSWKLFGGARLNPMLGVEAAYTNLGSLEREGASNGQHAALKNELKGLSASAVGYVPVMPNAELFGKAGIMQWERSSKKTNGSTTTNSTDKGISPLVGAGAQYKLNDNLHMRGEWEHGFNTGADSNYETDVDLYSVGLLYSTL